MPNHPPAKVERKVMNDNRIASTARAFQNVAADWLSLFALDTCLSAKQAFRNVGTVANHQIFQFRSISLLS
jgi:hypothetical protein